MKPCQSNKNQSIKKRVITRNKMEGPTFKKKKEPPKRANHKGNIIYITCMRHNNSALKFN
jgi:hypothetical protein